MKIFLPCLCALLSPFSVLLVLSPVTWFFMSCVQAYSFEQPHYHFLLTVPSIKSFWSVYFPFNLREFFIFIFFILILVTTVNTNASLSHQLSLITVFHILSLLLFPPFQLFFISDLGFCFTVLISFCVNSVTVLVYCLSQQQQRDESIKIHSNIDVFIFLLCYNYNWAQYRRCFLFTQRHSELFLKIFLRINMWLLW